MGIICGVEEAGRGPVIGPLVMAVASIDEKEEYRLKNIGVKDSKKLSPLQRERIFESLEEMEKKGILKFIIKIVSPQEIDDALNSDHTNLNFLEADTSIVLINGILQETNIGKAILDCPSNNIKSYQTYVKERLTKPIEVIAEHKADENYLIVAAASILAKVTRDQEVQKIKQEIGNDFGSGYPSDPKTQEFLEKYSEQYPGIFRKTWMSYKKSINKKNQKTLGDF